MIFAGVLAAAAIVFTAGAAIPGLGSMLGMGAGGTFAAAGGAAATGFGDVVGGVLASVGIGADTMIGSVLAGAVTSAGIGAAAGGAIAGVTGGDIGKGMEMGALTGAVTGGVTGGLSFDPLAPVNVTPATGSLASGAASTGAAGAADLSPVAVTPSPISAGATPATASATPGGAAAPTATPTGAPSAASAGPAGVPATAAAAAAAPATAAPAAATSGNGLFGGLLSNGPNGSGDFFGKVIGGIGTGLTQSQDATDAAKIGLNRDAAARDATSANYAQPVGANGSTPISGGGLIRAAAAPSGLQKPAAAFNPTARWVLDPVQRRLVLVPATGTTFSTPTA